LSKDTIESAKASDRYETAGVVVYHFALMGNAVCSWGSEQLVNSERMQTEIACFIHGSYVTCYHKLIVSPEYNAELPSLFCFFGCWGGGWWGNPKAIKTPKTVLQTITEKCRCPLDVLRGIIENHEGP
jgi:hypothetical protein